MFATIALLAALAAPMQLQQAETPGAPAPVEAAHPEVTQEGGVLDHAAEGAHGEAVAHGAGGHGNELDIMHHIQDAHEWETPFGVLHLPPAGSWMVGPIDMTPTKHVVFLWITAALVLLILIPSARLSRKTVGEAPRGARHNAIEALVLFLRDQVVMPNIGHGGEKFAPFVVTLFFFILVSNLLGLVPWGASATGNISVTAALALISFAAIEVAGMRALGPKGYLGTIVFIPHGLPKPLVPLMVLIMTPVELLGKLTKPFALAIRLFANMTAGHVLLLAIIGLIFVFGSFAIAVMPVAMAVALTFLELFVAFLQAYIFALLTSVFIGLIRHAH